MPLAWMVSSLSFWLSHQIYYLPTFNACSPLSGVQVLSLGHGRMPQLPQFIKAKARGLTVLTIALSLSSQLLVNYLPPFCSNTPSSSSSKVIDRNSLESPLGDLPVTLPSLSDFYVTCTGSFINLSMSLMLTSRLLLTVLIALRSGPSY